MPGRFFLPAVLLLLSLVSCSDSLIPPPPKAEDFRNSACIGEHCSTEYPWLADLSSPATLAYLQAERSYYERVQSSSERRLASEIEREIHLALGSLPYVSAPLIRYQSQWRTEEVPGSHYPLLERLPPGALRWQRVIDFSAILGDFPDGALSKVEFHPEKELIAFSFRRREGDPDSLGIFDIQSGALSVTRLDAIIDFTWSRQDTDLYIITSENRRPSKIWKINFGSSRAPQELLSVDELDGYISFGQRDAPQLIFLVEHHDRTRLLVDRKSKIAELYTVEKDKVRLADLWESLLYVLQVSPKGSTWNAIDLTDRRRTPLYSTQEEIAAARAANDKLVFISRRAGRENLAVFDRKSNRIIERFAGDRFSSYRFAATQDPHSESVVITREHPCIPSEMLFLNTSQLKLTPPMSPPIAGCDVQRLYSHSRDGTEIPMTVVSLRQAPVPKRAVLEGYGAYGAVIGSSFNLYQLPLLTRGMRVAYCHIRGGGFYGLQWHQAAVKDNKIRSVEDFQSCVDRLRELGISEIVIRGRSAGALPILNTMLRQPEKLEGVVIEQPFTDVLASALDESSPHTVKEYAEWGDPDSRDIKRGMLLYSPFQNIRPQSYPPLLMRATTKDELIGFSSQLRFLARLRGNTRGANRRPTVALFSSSATHSGEGDLFDEIRTEAEVLAFIVALFY